MITHLNLSNSKIIDGEVLPSMIQPNAIDVAVSKLYRLDDDTTIVLTEDEKSHRNSTEVQLMDGRYRLEAGVYNFETDLRIKVAADECAHLHVRSTLSRNGVSITSGLYDSGYVGGVGGQIHVPAGCKLEITPGTRVAQLIIQKARAVKQYSGSYQEAE